MWHLTRSCNTMYHLTAAQNSFVTKDVVANQQDRRYGSVTCANCRKFIKIPETSLLQSDKNQLFLCQDCKSPQVLNLIEKTIRMTVQDILYLVNCYKCELEIRVPRMEWKGGKQWKGVLLCKECIVAINIEQQNKAKIRIDQGEEEIENLSGIENHRADPLPEDDTNETLKGNDLPLADEQEFSRKRKAGSSLPLSRAPIAIKFTKKSVSEMERNAANKSMDGESLALQKDCDISGTTSQNASGSEFQASDTSKSQQTTQEKHSATKKKPSGTKHGNYCRVIGCHSNTNRDRHLKFFCIPNRDPKQRQLWLKRINRVNSDGTEWNPHNKAIICSAHFVGGFKSNIPRHPNYAPSIFPTGHVKSKTLADVKRFERALRRRYLTKAVEGSDTKQLEKSDVKEEIDDTLLKMEKNSNEPVDEWSQEAMDIVKDSFDEDVGPNSKDCRLRRLWMETGTMDLTIVCSNGDFIKCHKPIFSLISPWAAEILRSPSDSEETVIALPWCLKTTLEYLFKKVYCVSDSDEAVELPHLQELFLALQIDGVIGMSDDTLQKSPLCNVQADLYGESHLDTTETTSPAPTLNPDAEDANKSSVTQDETKETDQSQEKGQELFRECPSCNSIISSGETCSCQKSNVATKSEIKTCSICGLEVGTQKNLEFHVKSHEGTDEVKRSKLFQCGKCDEKFETGSNLVKHLNEYHKFSHHQIGPKPVVEPYYRKCRKCYELNTPGHVCELKQYLCPQCGITIEGNSTSIKRHIQKHSLVTLRCKSCDFTTLYQKLMKVHMKEHAPEVQAEVCDKCLEVKKPGHDVEHHGESLKYSCQLCSFKSNTKGIINRHEHKIHKIKPAPSEKIQCAKCPVMVVRGRIDRHERLRHDKNLPFSCQKCDYRALTQYGINLHTGTYHFERERIPCQNQCGQTFTQTCSMYEHVRRLCPKNTTKIKKKEDKEKSRAKKRALKDKFIKLRMELGLPGIILK